MLLRGIVMEFFFLNAFHSNEFFPLHILFIFLRDLSGGSNDKIAITTRIYWAIFRLVFRLLFQASKNVTANHKYSMWVLGSKHGKL